MAKVVLTGISKRFGTNAVLKAVDLTIRDGEFLSLVGPSGCGKSTLLRIIAGLERQDAGSVVIGAEAVDEYRAADRNLAMVFQSYALYPHLTVFDNIAVPLRMRRLTSLQRLPGFGWAMPGTRAAEQEIGECVKRVAELLGLGELLNRKPAQLSGGQRQRQRVAVGRAIVREPEAFLLDEPLSNLDAKLRVHMRTEIAQLHRRLGATFIYVTHDQAEAMTMSDRIAVMMDGIIVQLGTPEQVYDEPADLSVAEFIGSPKINLMAGHVREDGLAGLGANALPVTLDLARGSVVRIGVRPEAMRIVPPARGLVAGTVEHKENLGAEVLLHIRTAVSVLPLIVREEQGAARGIRIDHVVGLRFDPAAIRAFDANGRRVLLQPSVFAEAANG